jgi:hypothetical protein
MLYSAIQPQMSVEDHTKELGNGWGLFVEIDESYCKKKEEKLNKNKYLKNSLKHYSINIVPIEEETIQDIDIETGVAEYTVKQDKRVLAQIYSGISICLLTIYICFAA